MGLKILLQPLFKAKGSSECIVAVLETAKIEQACMYSAWTRSISKLNTLNHTQLSALLSSFVQPTERYALVRRHFSFLNCDVCNMVLIHINNKPAKPKLYYSSCLLHAQHEQSLTQESIKLAPGAQPWGQH